MNDWMLKDLKAKEKIIGFLTNLSGILVALNSSKLNEILRYK